MAKLNQKDKKLIADESLGKLVLSASPALDSLLSALTEDTDVKNVIAGTVTSALIKRLGKKKPGKG